MRSFSIKRRITLAVVAAELILVASLLLLASYIIRSNAIKSFDAALHGRGMSIAALVRYSEGPHPDLFFDSTLLPRVTEGIPDLYFIETENGRPLATSTPAPGFSSSNGKGSRVWDFSLNGVPFRALQLHGVPVLDSEEEEPTTPIMLNVTYAASTGDMNRALARALFGVLVGGILLLVISAYASIQSIERGLRPLSELTSSANSISAADWNLKVSPSAVTVVEIAPLARAMSQMVETLHAAFQQQRDFTSNAAHELKTPVAILKSTLQSLLQEPRTNNVYREGITDALFDLARLEDLLHSMLRLARADQQASANELRNLGAIDVVGTCEAAIARLAPLAQRHGTVISLSAPSDMLPVRAEPEDLEIVWANLIENAIRYSQANSTVKITAARHNGFVVVAVEDGGIGIPAAELSRVFERFHRSDPSRSRQGGGYGLGLAIAKAFVESYGGSIAATPIAPSGTRIGVELPISN